MSPLRATFVGQLKKIRDARSLSQLALALDADVSSGYVGEMETGRKFPRPETIDKLCRALRVPPVYFFTDADPLTFTPARPQARFDPVASPASHPSRLVSSRS